MTHQDETYNEQEEDKAEDTDHLPRVRMRLCHKSGVDCFHVLTLIEESLKIVHAVSQSVLPGSLRLLGHGGLDAQVVNLCQGQIIDVIRGNCDT